MILILILTLMALLSICGILFVVIVHNSLKNEDAFQELEEWEEWENNN